MKSNAQLYMEHLDQVTGRQEDVIRKVDSLDVDRPGISLFVYRNWPDDGVITCFTYGLSVAEHPDWVYGRPELTISMDSQDEAWGLAIAMTANQFRGNCPFSYGNTIDFRAEISTESSLDAFLVFAPAFLDKASSTIQLSGYRCSIVGMYPLYRSELSLFKEIGLESFWKHPDFDPLNPNRSPLRTS